MSKLDQLLEQLPTYISCYVDDEGNMSKFAADYGTFGYKGSHNRSGHLVFWKTGRYWEATYGAQYTEDHVHGFFGAGHTLEEAAESLLEDVKEKIPEYYNK